MWKLCTTNILLYNFFLVLVVGGGTCIMHADQAHELALCPITCPDWTMYSFLCTLKCTAKYDLWANLLPQCG